MTKEKIFESIMAWGTALTILIGPAFIIGLCPENKLLLLVICIIAGVISRIAEHIECKIDQSNVELIMLFVASFTFILSLYSLLAFFVLCGTISTILFIVAFVVFALIRY